MMKYALLMFALLWAGVSFGTGFQNDVQKKRADYFATEAIKYFNLKESKKQAIYEAKLELMKVQGEMQKRVKSGELAEEDKKDYHKENVQPYARKLMQTMGITWKELKPFNEKVQPEMNKIRKDK